MSRMRPWALLCLASGILFFAGFSLRRSTTTPPPVVTENQKATGRLQASGDSAQFTHSRLRRLLTDPAVSWADVSPVEKHLVQLTDAEREIVFRKLVAAWRGGNVSRWMPQLVVCLADWESPLAEAILAA